MGLPRIPTVSQLDLTLDGESPHMTLTNPRLPERALTRAGDAGDDVIR